MLLVTHIYIVMYTQAYFAAARQHVKSTRCLFCFPRHQIEALAHDVRVESDPVFVQVGPTSSADGAADPSITQRVCNVLQTYFEYN